MNTDLLRYNAYTGIRNAGIIQVRAIRRSFRLSKLRVLKDYLLARVAARNHPAPEDAATMPLVVQRNFSPMTAIRALAFLDGEGYPMVVPVLSLQPAGKHTLVCAEGLAADSLEPLSAGTPVTASLLTLDVISFQAKGRWLGTRWFLGMPVGTMIVTSVYAGGPPIPGRQVV